MSPERYFSYFFDLAPPKAAQGTPRRRKMSLLVSFLGLLVSFLILLVVFVSCWSFFGLFLVFCSSFGLVFGSGGLSVWCLGRLGFVLGSVSYCVLGSVSSRLLCLVGLLVSWSFRSFGFVFWSVGLGVFDFCCLSSRLFGLFRLLVFWSSMSRVLVFFDIHVSNMSCRDSYWTLPLGPWVLRGGFLV